MSSTPHPADRASSSFTTPEQTGSSPSPTPGPTSGQAGAPLAMSHREIMEALSGLLIALFVAMLSSTVVTNALPAIVSDLHGSETGYTWVVVATLLTLTASTPIWGKLADLFSKKLLVQLALVIYVVGSLIAAFAPNMGVLIGARAVQGLGVGGLTALVQVVIASMVSPRERGRYSGYIGAVFALATVSGPLIGGLIVDAPGLGWRWCFGVGIPIAAIAFVVLQRTLKLPVVRREVKIDYLGAVLIAGGISVLLAWVSLAGSSYAWLSATSGALVAGGLVVLALAVFVEVRVASDPMIPTRLFRDRTTVLATTASIMVGVAMFGATVYLSQYFQLSRGMSPTRAGLMSIAMVGGLLVSSITIGRIISNTGRYKRYLVGGMVLVIAGLLLLSRIDENTPLLEVGAFMAVVGLGLGATMQNLVLAVQNNAAQSDMGAASALVAFFRSMGGAIGVSALGALLSSQVADSLATGLARLGLTPPAGSGSTSVPDLGALPAPVRALYQSAFGEATGHLFLVAAPFAVIALVCVVFIKEVPLRSTLDKEDVEAPLGNAPVLDEVFEREEQEVLAGPLARQPVGRHVR